MTIEWLPSLAYRSEELPRKFRAKSRLDRLLKHVKGLKQIDISEGKFGIADFISFDDALRQELRSALGEILTYIGPPIRERPFNMFIEAPPGAGKSFLVKSLARATQDACNLEVPVREINLACLQSYDALVSFLVSVRSLVPDTGKAATEMVPFVLFDEVDAEMPGFNIFQRLLMPMWDGKLMSRPGVLDLPRMVFFFAGTPAGLQRTVTRARRATSEWFDVLQTALRPMSSSAMAMTELFVRGLDLLRKNLVFVSRTRQQWIQGQHDQLIELASNSLLPKMGDFIDRIDRFIYLPTSTSYFRDLDNDGTLYPGDRETLHFLAIKLTHQFPDLTGITNAAVTALVGRFYKSRRMMTRVVTLSRANEATTYDLKNLPLGFLDTRSASALAHDFPGKIEIVTS